VQLGIPARSSCFDSGAEARVSTEIAPSSSHPQTTSHHRDSRHTHCHGCVVVRRVDGHELQRVHNTQRRVPLVP